MTETREQIEARVWEEAHEQAPAYCMESFKSGYSKGAILRELKIARLKADRRAFSEETQTYRDAWLADQKKIAEQAERIEIMNEIINELEDYATSGVTHTYDRVREALNSLYDRLDLIYPPSGKGGGG